MDVTPQGTATQFARSHCLKLFTEGNALFWIQCSCYVEHLLGLDPTRYAIPHILSIGRFDMVAKTWKTIQCDIDTDCKFWSFAVVPGVGGLPASLLMLLSKRQLMLYLFPLLWHKIEKRIDRRRHRVYCKAPKQSNMTANIVHVPSSNATASDKYAQFLVILDKEGLTTRRMVYRLAVDKRRDIVRPLALWSAELYNGGVLRHWMYTKQSVSQLSTWGRRPSPLSKHVCMKCKPWQLEPTSAVKNQHWDDSTAGPTLYTTDSTRLLLMGEEPRPANKHRPLDEMMCSICYHRPTNADQLLNKDIRVRPCNCMGYCHQECMDRWALWSKHGNYHWRAHNNQLSGGWRFWNEWQGLFACPLCLQAYPSVLGHVRPMYQIMQAAKGLMQDKYHWIIQLRVMILMLCTLLLAMYPSVQSFVHAVVMALLEHFYYRICCALNPQWSLPYAICRVDMLLLMYAAVAPEFIPEFMLHNIPVPIPQFMLQFFPEFIHFAIRIEFVFISCAALLMVSNPLVALVAMCYVEVVILGPHIVAMFTAKFIDRKGPLIRRTKSLTNMSTCQSYY